VYGPRARYLGARHDADHRTPICRTLACRQRGVRRAGGADGNVDHVRRGAAGQPAMRLYLYSRLFRWVSTHRLLVLGATLVVHLAGILLSLRIDLDEDVLAILPQRDPIVDDYHYALRKFRQIDRVYFDVSVDTDNPDLLAQAADALDAGLETNGSFAKITY